MVSLSPHLKAKDARNHVDYGSHEYLSQLGDLYELEDVNIVVDSEYYGHHGREE